MKVPKIVAGSKATRVAFQLYRALDIFQSNETDPNQSQSDSYCRSKVKFGDSVISATVVDRLDYSFEPKMFVRIAFSGQSSGDRKVVEKKTFHSLNHSLCSNPEI